MYVLFPAEMFSIPVVMSVTVALILITVVDNVGVVAFDNVLFTVGFVVSIVISFLVDCVSAVPSVMFAHHSYVPSDRVMLDWLVISNDDAGPCVMFSAITIIVPLSTKNDVVSVCESGSVIS